MSLPSVNPPNWYLYLLRVHSNAILAYNCTTEEIEPNAEIREKKKSYPYNISGQWR